MPDAREYRLVVADAEQAARAGDYPRADVLMREALRLQESTLGSLHPDLASTLNNLAVVCEAIGQIDDAEQFYRRACAVASWSRPPTDPLVITSRENLKDFCVAQGRPFEEWPEIARGEAPAAVAPAPAPHAAVSSPHSHASPVPPVSPASPAVRPAAARASTAPPAGRAARASVVPATSSRVPRTPAAPPSSVKRPAWMTPVVGAVALVAIIGAVVLVRSWRATPPVERAAVVQTEAPPTTPPAAPEALSPAPPSPAAAPGDSAGEPPAVLTPPVPAAAPPATPDPPAAASSPPSPPASTTAAPAGVRVVVAEVCASLSTSGAWRCDPLETPAPAGRAVFYTRIASPSGMRVEHRWYQGPTLRQTVPLSIAANPSAGYRTFSRQTLTAGAWRVELRAADGTVLHEAAFEVR